MGAIIVSAIGLIMTGYTLVYGSTITPPRSLGRWFVAGLASFVATEFSFMPVVRLAELRIGGVDEWIAMAALAIALRYGVETFFTGGKS